MTSTPADPAACAAPVTTVGAVSAAAPVRETLGIHVSSTAEMTGLHALERAAPSLPMRPGQVDRRAFADLRHGPQSLIATCPVATGQVGAPSRGPTRTAEDCAAHIAQTIAADPAAGDLFRVDRLNTPQSATLVRLVAAGAGDPDALGVQGASGILASLARRAAFLSDPCRWIPFVELPTHPSWLTQIESWLSILVRRRLTRASFTATEDLRRPILAFIAYVNQHAQPFRWTYTGRHLMA